MAGIPSLLRLAEHRALAHVTLNGAVLDLGGDTNSEYLSFIQGSFTPTRVNFDPKTKPDIMHDLEQPLPVSNATYDGAVLFNVLEHIFEYRALLEESIRVLKPGGTILIVVPFLFPVHPSPDDFHRFTGSTLRKELERLGMQEIVIVPLGGGVWSARYLMLDRLLPKPLRLINFYTFRHLAEFFDRAMVSLANMSGKKYDPAHYALGFCVTATKV
jgi:SAM-dependent methyltransferase